jgi:Bacterial membrane protein YfhO
MQKTWYKPFLPHVVAVGIFLLVSFLFCQPAFQHKTLSQNDNDQWKAMARNSFVYKETHGHFPLWTQGMFSGMPAYQIAMDAPALSPQYLIYNIFTLHLPDPANFFFLGCICFYILAMALRVNPYVAIIGALAYAYTTYNPTALVVGHETKIQAIQIMPAFLAGLILIFEKRYWLGTATFALFTALFIAANHPQISYYGGIIAAFMTVAYVIRWLGAREYRHLITAGFLTVAGAVIGLACNAVVTLTTFDYAKASLRDGSVLATPGGNVTKTGLSQDYALSYSMYKTESFELLVPKIYGGGGPLNAMIAQDDSKAIAALQNMPPQAANIFQEDLFYWGGIGSSTGGPAYAGAVICFLALLSFFLLDGKHKWWILAACIFGIFIAWGSNFVAFNSILLKVLPGLNKFRAPSVAICIPNLLFCWLAIESLDKLFKLPAADRVQIGQQYKKGLYLTGGVFVLLLICYLTFDYTSEGDRRLQQKFAAAQPQVQDLVHNYLHELRADRQTIFFDSLTRSFLFVLAAAALGFAWVKGRLKPILAMSLIGALAVIDILALDTGYMNGESYREEEEAQAPFAATPADQQILKDTSYYRVFDLRYGAGSMITNLATAAWFHRTIGGYHPAKLSIYEDLLENQLEKYPEGQSVINMLNTKYLLLPAASGRGDSAALNPNANGPVWFVKGIRTAPDPRTLMDGLTNLNTKDTALLLPGDSAGVGKAVGVGEMVLSGTPILFGDTIYLTNNDNDEITYRSASNEPRFAVFSEVYYDRGWHVYVDDKETPIIRTDYVLRGLAIPAGQHTIRFTFHPASYYTGRVIQIIASIVLLALLIMAAVKERRPSVIKRRPVQKS